MASFARFRATKFKRLLCCIFKIKTYLQNLLKKYLICMMQHTKRLKTIAVPKKQQTGLMTNSSNC